ncbi:MAG: D-alanyl-D-alanine carboxypeptidase [Ruminococcus sp.]|nr:D-alanyl-D-alanine carboxypeptidase [Ruminococcus sp.]
MSAQAYVLYCVENDTVLLSRNADKKLKMASTTKIMTALLTLEEAKKHDKMVTFSESMIAQGSSMYLKVGDTVHLSDLAIGMLMASGNDAANAAAITISGSVENFSKLMNERAKKLEMKNTSFVTPSGLDDDNHYSTAYDLALLMAHALRNEQFCEISKNKSMTVDFFTPQKKVTYQNHNKLLSLYEYCVSGKTGYTQSAGRCLVTASKKDGLTLIAVTLNAPSDWNDHIKLYDYGFGRFCAIDTDLSDERYFADVVGSDVDVVELYSNKGKNTVLDIDKKDSVTKTIYKPEFIYAPVKKGDRVALVEYSLDGKVIHKEYLYASADAKRIKEKDIFDYIKDLFRD